MKTLFISSAGEGFGLARRMAEGGADVFFGCNAPGMVSPGLEEPVQLVSVWRKFLDVDLIVVDSPQVSYTLDDTLRTLSSRPVFGHNKVLTLASGARGQEFVQRVWGLPSPDLDVGPGIRADLLCFWRGVDWVRPSFLVFNEPRFLVGDLGMRVGSMGALIIALPEDCKLNKQLRDPLTPFIDRTTYRGSVAISSLISSKAAAVNQVTAPAPVIYQEILPEVVLDELALSYHDIAAGGFLEFKVRARDYLLGVLVSSPPWPAVGKPPSGEEFLKLDISPGALRHTFLRNAYRAGDDWFSRGPGPVFTSTSRGRTVREARNRAYRNITQVCASKSVQYRLDIGKRVDRTYKNLHEIETVEEAGRGGHGGDMKTLQAWGWF